MTTSSDSSLESSVEADRLLARIEMATALSQAEIDTGCPPKTAAAIQTAQKVVGSYALSLVKAQPVAFAMRFLSNPATLAMLTSPALTTAIKKLRQQEADLLLSTSQRETVVGQLQAELKAAKSIVSQTRRLMRQEEKRLKEDQTALARIHEFIRPETLAEDSG